MRNLMPFLGCTVGLAVVFAMIGFIGGVVEGLVFGDGELVPSLKNGAFAAVMVGTGTFIAAALLAMRDGSRQASAFKQVRQRLCAREDCSDAEFTSALSEMDAEILLEMRRIIAKGLNVPAEKIWPQDNPQADYQLELLGPGLQLGIIAHMLESRKLRPTTGIISVGTTSTFQQLVEAVNKNLANSELMPPEIEPGK